MRNLLSELLNMQKAEYKKNEIGQKSNIRTNLFSSSSSSSSSSSTSLSEFPKGPLWEDSTLIIRYEELTSLKHIASNERNVVSSAKYQGKSVAVKRSQQRDEFEHELKNFLLVNSGINEPSGIIQLRKFGFFQVQLPWGPHTFYFMVMDLMPQTLQNLLDDEKTVLPWDIRLNIAVKIAQILKILEMKKLIHRDINTNNILLDKDLNPKLADFESIISYSEADNFVGTLSWLAPEYIKSRLHLPMGDVFNFGLVLWRLINRKLPFRSSYPDDIEKIEIPKDCPVGLVALALECCNEDPAQRLSRDEILYGLRQIRPEEKPLLPSIPSLERLFKRKIIDYNSIKFLSSEFRKADLNANIYSVAHSRRALALKWINCVYSAEFVREFKILNKLRGKCEGVVQLEGFGAYERQLSSGARIITHYFLLVSPLLSRTLHELLESKEDISWNTRLLIALNLAETLKKLSQEKIIHTDLHSKNIWLTKDLSPRLLGFGHAKMLNEPGADYKSETPDRTIPEKFGEVLLHLITRKFPVKMEDIPQDCPQDLITLSEECYHQKPEKRPELDDIVSRLQKMKSAQTKSETPGLLSASFWTNLFSSSSSSGSPNSGASPIRLI
jgi:serine/threonine protein kinase